MLFKRVLVISILAFPSLIVSKTCTDFNANNEIIGHHTAWFHCQAKDGKPGTVNSCNCNDPLSIDCRKACKKIL